MGTLWIERQYILRINKNEGVSAMFRKICFSAVLLGLAYGLYVLLFGDPFAQSCKVSVERMKPTEAQLADRWIDMKAEGNTVVLYDYSQNPESTYTAMVQNITIHLLWVQVLLR